MPSREAGRSNSALVRNSMETECVCENIHSRPKLRQSEPAPEDVVCILVEDGHSIERAKFSCSLCAISIGVEREGSTYGHTTNALCRIFFVGEGQSLDIVHFSRLFLPSKLTRACAACFIPGRIPICDPNCLRIRERSSAKYQTNHEWNSPYSHRLEL